MRHFESIKDTINVELQGLRDAYDRIDSSFDELINFLLKVNGKVILFGVGKSGHIAKKISATLSSTGTSSFFVHPTESMHGDLGMVEQNDVIIAISYSGSTTELIRPLKYLKDRDIGIVGMSKDINSPLGKLCDYHIDISVSKEACPLESAPTTSTTLTLVMGDALAVALMRAKNFKVSDFAKFHPGGDLGKRLFVKVKDIMSSINLPIVDINTTLKESLVVMSEAKLGMLIIVDDGATKGIITDGDIRRILLSGDFPANDLISKFMIENYHTVSEDSLAIDALSIIEKYKIQSLIVEDKDSKVIKGVLLLHKLIEEGIKSAT